MIVMGPQQELVVRASGDKITISFGNTVLQNSTLLTRDESVLLAGALLDAVNSAGGMEIVFYEEE